MAFKIKRFKVTTETHHIGTYSLPSGHAISAHCTITSGQPPKWVYSEPPEGLSEVDREYWFTTIHPTLEGELKQKTGINRATSRRLQVLKEITFGDLPH